MRKVIGKASGNEVMFRQRLECVFVLTAVCFTFWRKMILSTVYTFKDTARDHDAIIFLSSALPSPIYTSKETYEIPLIVTSFEVEKFQL